MGKGGGSSDEDNVTLHGEAFCTGLVSRQLLWCWSHSRINLTFAVLGKS